MKKFLPTSILSEAEVLSVNRKGFTTFMKTERGFTLIELLVVITIIAILSVMGMTVFTGVQKNAREAGRRGDIDAIVKALEVNKTASGYQPLAANQFANGAIPTADPQARPYCINTGAGVADPTTWTTSCPTSWNPVSNTVPTTNSTSFKVCAATETTGTGGTAGVLCRANSQ